MHGLLLRKDRVRTSAVCALCFEDRDINLDEPYRQDDGSLTKLPFNLGDYCVDYVAISSFFKQCFSSVHF